MLCYTSSLSGYLFTYQYISLSVLLLMLQIKLKNEKNENKCLSVAVISLFVCKSNTYCLFTAFSQLCVIGPNVYGVFLCIAVLNVTMFVHVCFLSHFIARIALHFICGEFFIMFQYSIYQIICMLSELIPEILFSCDGCYFNLFAVPSYYAACHCDLDCV